MFVATIDLRRWAVKGAEQRLVEIAEEARTIFAAFPELRDQGRGFNANARGSSGEASVTPPAAPTRRRRGKLSAAGRRRISEAQKARWAKQRDASAAAPEARKKK
jgi:hypothetical protein